MVGQKPCLRRREAGAVLGRATIPPPAPPPGG
eukprot:SAG22_NODE_4398_length_1282_cov_2.201183_1_plen_31_part_10